MNSLRRTATTLPAFLAIWCLLAAQQAPAEQGPYAGLEAREIKALSAEQIAAYEAGSGMGLALAAELNGLPGPKHVLELAEDLALTDAHSRDTNEVYSVMKSKAVEIGRRIIELEEALDAAFQAGDLSEEGLLEQVSAIAEAQGRLRFVHLRAHLRMGEILTRHQVHAYSSLRGYDSTSHQDEHGSHGGEHDPARH